MKPPIKH